MRVEQRDTMEAPAAGDELPFLAYDIVCHKKYLSSGQAFARLDFLRLFLIVYVQDA